MESPVKRIREKVLGLSQEDFAEMAGVSQPYLSKVECGRIEIRGKLRSFLEELLSDDVDDVVKKQIKCIQEHKRQLQERKEQLLSEAEAVLAVQENGEQSQS